MKRRDHERIVRNTVEALRFRHAIEMNDLESACNNYVAHLEDQEGVIRSQGEQIDYLQSEVSRLRDEVHQLRMWKANSLSRLMAEIHDGVQDRG